jgi:type I restriction enzyme S subunit
MSNEIVELADVIATIRNGANLQQYDRFADGMLPISRIETISDGTIDWTRVKYALPPQDGNHLLRSGDILFSHINSPEHIGKAALFDSYRKMIHGINLLLLRVDDSRCDSKYLNFYLRSSAVRAHFRARCKRAVNQASLNQSDILSLPLPLPDLNTQRALAYQLDRTVALRAIHVEALRQADHLFQTLLHQAFSSQ